MDAEGLRLIADIAADAEAADGVAPLDEANWLALRHRPEAMDFWTDPAGFAMLAGDDLSLVVRPPDRGRGKGGRLLARALADIDQQRGEATLHAWSHADHPAAAALAKQHAFDRVRALWVMRRPATAPAGRAVVPEGVVVRGFRQGDEEELLRVNAAAFAAHPEQGQMTASDLAERMGEPWFDPAGLLVASRGRELLGFHWTKQHSPALGEVYVVGVDPAAQGTGLGRALTQAGLKHLAGRGVSEVQLYVESDNAAAIGLYSGLGFTHADRDTHVQYRRG